MKNPNYEAKWKKQELNSLIIATEMSEKRLENESRMLAHYIRCKALGCFNSPEKYSKRIRDE